MAEPLFPSRAEAVKAEAGRVEAEWMHDFGAWMTAEQRRVYALCQRMLQDPDEADSATQDVFLKAYQALQKEDAKALDDPARWLSRIAVNTCLDRLRSRKWQFWRRRPQPADEEIILGMARSKAPEGEQKLLASEIGARLEMALSRLSDRQRAVFTLRHYDEMSLEEIGATLGLDVGTVKAHMFRAVGKLRIELKDLYQGGEP
ncbi:MAG: RNA polymerase sigma factor [Bryobacteraceae bacterium]